MTSMHRLRTSIALAATAAAVLVAPALAAAGVTGTEGPLLTGASVSDVTSTSATLHSVINAGGYPMTWHLQWSQDESYSNETTGGGWESGYTPSLALTGLTPNTLYHYRALSGYWHGFIGGADQPVSQHQAIVGSFTTLADTAVVPPPVGPPPVDPNVCHNPLITSAEPMAVMVGERIVFTGSGFGVIGILKFGDVPASTVESWTPTLIAARVPAGAGPQVTVTCADGTVSPPITISILSPLNQAPVAVVDNLGSAAKPVLDSSGSFDIDGAVVKRAWTSGKKKLSSKFIYRPKLKPGNGMKVTLTVWDARGASDHVTVTLKAPVKVKVKIKTMKPVMHTLVVSLNAQVLFGFDRSALSASGRNAVARLKVLAKRSSVITIAGFASQEGPADYNLALSRDRAGSVESALLSGVKTKAKVKVLANGEAGHPRTRETSPRARQMNRKVIVTMTYTTSG